MQLKETGKEKEGHEEAYERVEWENGKMANGKKRTHLKMYQWLAELLTFSFRCRVGICIDTWAREEMPGQ